MTTIICGTGRGCEDACPVRNVGATCPSLYEHALEFVRNNLVPQAAERREAAWGVVV